MNKDINTGMAVLISVMVIGIILGLFTAQKLSVEMKGISSDLKSLETSMEFSIKSVDSSVKELKTSLSEKEMGAFRRDMQENGRRMLSLNYAGSFGKWEAAKNEADELDDSLQNAAILRPELAQAIQLFRSTYIPKLKEAANKKDANNFITIWNESYNACINCHRNEEAPSSAVEVLREISAEVEQLSG